MKYLLFVLLSTGFPFSSEGQNVVTDSAIYEPIKMLFDGMHRGDSAMVRQAFMPNANMATVGQDKTGKSFLRYNDLHDFLIAIGTPHGEAWTERVWDIKIQHDGALAQVWGKYAFYVGDKLNHGGVDAFQLFKETDGEWKIFFVADTRQNDGCTVPSMNKEPIKR